jgi:uncharacterized protein
MKRRWVMAGALALVAAQGALAAGDGAAKLRDWMRLIELDAARDVRRWLQEGQDPNVIGANGHAGLHWALMNQSGGAVAALLADPRTDVEAPNARGESPLMLAALRGRLDWVQQLVARGAQIDPEPGARRWRALHYAASGESVAVVTWLLEQGASMDARSPNGSTAVMLAWGYGPVDAGVLLLQRGASQQLRNDVGLQAWDFAQRAGRADLAKRAGLKPNS